MKAQIASSTAGIRDENPAAWQRSLEGSRSTRPVARCEQRDTRRVLAIFCFFLFPKTDSQLIALHSHKDGGNAGNPKSIPEHSGMHPTCRTTPSESGAASRLLNQLSEILPFITSWGNISKNPGASRNVLKQIGNVGGN